MQVALFVAILELLGGHRKGLNQRETRAKSYATIIYSETKNEKDLEIPEVVVAVMMKESSFRDKAIGRHGELGVMQVKPDGMAKKVCKDLIHLLDKPVYNVRCGIRILKYAKSLCGGDPENWLGIYNGIQNCGPSAYARKVLRYRPDLHSPTS